MWFGLLKFDLDTWVVTKLIWTIDYIMCNDEIESTMKGLFLPNYCNSHFWQLKKSLCLIGNLHEKNQSRIFIILIILTLLSSGYTDP